METIFGYARAGVSVVMVIVGPLFYVMVERQFAVGGRRARSSGRAEWVVIWVVAAIILALVVLMFVTGSPVYSAIGTSLFNLSFAVLSFRALVMVSGSPTGRHDPIRSFLWYSAVAHPLIVADMRRIVSRAGDDQEVPIDLVQAMGLTARETEVVRTLLDGMTSRDAAERLFISQRTVEAHVSNVYQKCGVGNRVELVQLVGRYRTG